MAPQRRIKARRGSEHRAQSVHSRAQSQPFQFSCSPNSLLQTQWYARVRVGGWEGGREGEAGGGGRDGGAGAVQRVLRLEVVSVALASAAAVVPKPQRDIARVSRLPSGACLAAVVAYRCAQHLVGSARFAHAALRIRRALVGARPARSKRGVGRMSGPLSSCRC